MDAGGTAESGHILKMDYVELHSIRGCSDTTEGRKGLHIGSTTELRLAPSVDSVKPPSSYSRNLPVSRRSRFYDTPRLTTSP